MSPSSTNAPAPESSAEYRSGSPGQVIRGRYRLERFIGAGGMASVWEAYDSRVGEDVAIKLLARNLLGNSEARLRFTREGQAAGALRSKFVVRLFDAGETEDEVPFLVMELLEGETLEQRLQRAPRVTIEDIVRIGVQSARGLSHAHRRGIVHRDIKPGNIFLHQRTASPGAAPVAKLLDFGVAKLPAALADGGASAVGAVLGTPDFMSPEQVRGLPTVDTRSDLYSLGMVVFTMLAARLPWTATAFGDLVLSICTAPLPLPSASVPGLPGALDTWFQRACAREPGERFQSAHDLALALHFAAGLEGEMSQYLDIGHIPVRATARMLSDAEPMSELPTQRWLPPVED